MLDDKDLEYIERNWKAIPLSAIADKFGIPLLELIPILRRRGIVTEIQPIELQFIDNNLQKMPSGEIQKRLNLTSTQFDQICRNVLRKKRRKGREEITLDEAISKTRWLIEEKLKLPLDDFLPKRITGKAFTDNGLYDCIDFATKAKRHDPYYKQFIAVAFLICNAYPRHFKPFQFGETKQNSYFKGKGGRKNVLNSIRWVIENKMGISLDMLEIVSKNRYFLKPRHLQFYGLGYKQFKQFFPKKSELISALLKIHSQEKVLLPGNTRELRKILSNVGVDAYSCNVPKCDYDKEYGIEIHRIIPKSKCDEIGIEMDMPDNLIPICPNHHRIGSSLDWRGFLKLSPPGWRKALIDQILEWVGNK